MRPSLITDFRVAVFDFPIYYTLKHSIRSNDYGGLKCDGHRAPGIMGSDPVRSCTFIENHDTIAPVDRSDRSVDLAIGSIDSIDSKNFWISLPRWGARDLSGVKVSALYDAWRPKKRRKTKMKNLDFLANSIRSIR